MNLLPTNPDRKTYVELFNQDDIWIKAIKYLADKHKLSGDFSALAKIVYPLNPEGL